MGRLNLANIEMRKSEKFFYLLNSKRPYGTGDRKGAPLHVGPVRRGIRLPVPSYVFLHVWGDRKGAAPTGFPVMV